MTGESVMNPLDNSCQRADVLEGVCPHCPGAEGGHTLAWKGQSVPSTHPRTLGLALPSQPQDGPGPLPQHDPSRTFQKVSLFPLKCSLL